MRWRRRLGVRAAAFALTVLSGVSLATPSAAQEARSNQAPPSDATDDVVHLDGGGFYRGRVVEIVPGDHVTVAVEAGGTIKIAWDDVDRIVASTGPSKPPLVIQAHPSRAAPAVPAPEPAMPPPSPPAPVSGATPERLDAPPPDVPARPRTAWRPNQPLLVTGSIVFAVGYGPNVVAALPSAAGLVGRVAVFVLSIGLVALACSLGSGGGYICEGNHGAVQLLVPFAGPFLFAANHPHDSVLNEHGTPLSDVTKGLLYTSAGLQIAGFSAILASLAMGKREPVPGPKVRSAAPSFFVTPLADASTLGLSVGFYRW